MESQDDSIVKSIIYGNILQTSYGMMRALCSAINAKDHIDKIILYLRNNHNFQKYNKYIYAFRLEQYTAQLFITENAINQQKEKFLEGYNDDTGLQGNGEKLLALLQKFNVRNVLVIIAIRQKDPLRELHAENYVQIVKCAKQLLSSLYDKVIVAKNNEEHYTVRNSEDFIKEPLPTKQYKIPLQDYTKTSTPTENPNYVGKQHIRRIKEPSLTEKHKTEITFLNQKIKELASVLEEIIQKFTENEDAQAKFAIRYDKSRKVVKVFELLAHLFDCETKEDLLDENMSTHLRSITSRNLTSVTIRQLNEELMSDKSLRSENIVKENKICGILVEFLEVLLKSYAFAKKLAIIESQIQEDQNHGESLNQPITFDMKK